VEKVEQAIQILERHFQADPKTKDLIVSFNRFADSSLNLYVAHWWDGTDWKEYMAGLQKLNLGLMKKFNEAGINFAFPTQTVYLKQDSEWRMQPTVSRPGSQGLHD
jgi:MscS family membrane protein